MVMVMVTQTTTMTWGCLSRSDFADMTTMLVISV